MTYQSLADATDCLAQATRHPADGAQYVAPAERASRVADGAAHAANRLAERVLRARRDAADGVAHQGADARLLLLLLLLTRDHRTRHSTRRG